MQRQSSAHTGFTNTMRAITHLLSPEMPVLRHGRRLLPLQQPPHRNRAHEDAKGGHRSHPHVDEARREVVSERAERAPSLLISTQGLLGEAFRAQIAAAELGDNGAVAGEGPRLEHDLLLLVGPEAVAVIGGPHWRRYHGHETVHRSVMSGGRERGSPAFVLRVSGGRCQDGGCRAASGSRSARRDVAARCDVRDDVLPTAIGEGARYREARKGQNVQNKQVMPGYELPELIMEPTHWPNCPSKSPSVAVKQARLEQTDQ